MAPAEVANGDHNQMPLTEYSAAPTKEELSKAPASYAIPTEYLLPDGHPDYLRLILASRVYEVVQETPLTRAQNLSQRYKCDVLLKREDLQPVFSFKLRGAYNKMAHLDEESRWKGVIAVSAGNHAQGVAYSARKLKIPATIVMPSGTPSIKHLNVSRLGGSVVLNGDDFDSAKLKAQEMEKAYGLTNIPPFDDPYVIAGQGTIGMELLRQTDIRRLKAVFCCVGGGGLIAGVGFFLKRIAPQVKVIGVETYDANAMVQSLKAGRRVQLSEVGLFADGAAVKTVGEETFRLCKEVVDQVIEVTTDETCAAIKDMFEDTRSIVEPAGALALAGMKKYITGLNPPPNSRPGTSSSNTHPSDSLNGGLAPEEPSSSDVEDNANDFDPSFSTDPDLPPQYVALASGANMNFDRLRFVAERAALGENREVLLSVTIPELPGAFATLIQLVLPHAVTEFSYRYAGPKIAHVLMGISILDPTRREKEVRELIKRIEAPVKTKAPTKPLAATMDGIDSSTTAAQEPPPPARMRARDLSGDELAKSHIRHLVGGRSSCADENLYMFEFPERPGALVKFLLTLQPGEHNISLFHYRNQGGDVGKILAGIQCPDEGGKKGVLEEWLRRLGYPFEDVSDSESYRMFLREEEVGKG